MPNDTSTHPQPENPLASVLNAVKDSGLNEFKITGQLPGEGLLIKIVEALTTNRTTMSQDNRDRYDKMQLDMLEAIQTPIIDGIKRLTEFVNRSIESQTNPKPAKPPKE